MNKEIVFVALILIVVVILGGGIYLIFMEKGVRYENSDKLCWTKQNCITVEIFNTPYERKKGLMNRPSLDKDKGALFEYKSNEMQSMWMKNMAFPLDIIWINKTSHIIYIHNDVKPCLKKPCETYDSPAPVSHAVEVNANYSRKNRLKRGMKVRLPMK